MAEAIFRAEIKKRKIKYVDTASAGIFAQGNESISESSAACLRSLNVDFSKFKPRQLRHKMIESSFLVFCMTADQKELLNDFENVYAVKDVCGFDIPDPYGGDIEAYRRTADLICRAVDIIIQKFFCTQMNK